MHNQRNNAHHAGLLLLAACCHAPNVTAAPTQETPPPDGARSADCIVRITFDPGVIPLDTELMIAILESSGVTRAAARDVLGPDATNLEEPAAVEFWPIGPDEGFVPTSGDTPQFLPSGGAYRTIIGRLHVEVLGTDDHPLEPRAETLLARVCERLTDALEAAARSDHDALRQRTARATEMLERAQARLSELQGMRRALAAEIGLVDLSRDAVVDQAHELNMEKQDLELELQSHEVRRNGLQHRIADIGERIGQAPESPIYQELAQIIQLREDAAKEAAALVERGHADQDALREAREQLAEARVELAQHRQEASEMYGADRLAALNDELAMLSIEAAETEVRLRFTRDRLATLTDPKLLEALDRYERTAMLELPVAAEAVESAMRLKHHLEQQLHATQTPTVTVLGAP